MIRRNITVSFSIIFNISHSAPVVTKHTHNVGDVKVEMRDELLIWCFLILNNNLSSTVVIVIVHQSRK